MMGWFRKRRRPEAPAGPDRPAAPEQDAEAADAGRRAHATDGEPHSLVVELKEDLQHAKEDLQHAVEKSVPAPVRWTVGKLVRLSFLVLASLVVVAIVSAILYLGNRTELVAHELTLFLNTTLARRSNVQVEIANVSGNPFRHVRLISPKVRFIDERDGPSFLEAPWIDLSYEPLSLLPGREPRIRIRVASPVVRVVQRPDGTLRVPTWRGAPDAGRGAQPGRDLDVRLVVEGATVHMPKPLADIRDMKLDVSAKTGGGTHVAIHNLSWKEGPYATRKLDLQGSLWFTDSLRLEVQRARTADVALRASGRWPARGGEGVIEVEVERLPWRWLAEVTDNHSFEADGSARGSVHARLGKDARGSFEVRADWNDLPVNAHGQFAWANERLTVDPLVGASPAGNLDGDLAWSRAGWEVGGNAVQANPARWDAIHIPGWPEGNLQGRFRYAVDTRTRAQDAHLDATLGTSTLQGWNVDAATVAVRFPAQGADSFAVTIQRRGGTFDLRGAADDGGWAGAYHLARFPLDEWPDGRASGLAGNATEGAGTVVSRDGALAIEGTMEGVDLSWFGAEGTSWRLERMRGALLPVPDLEVVAWTGPTTFLGIAFDSLHAVTHVGDGGARLDSIAGFASDTLIQVAGDVAWQDRGWALTLDRARATSDQFAWVADPPVTLHGDAHGVDFDRVLAHDGDAAIEVEGRWAAAGGRYDWRGRATRLDLSRIGLPPEWGLAGVTNASVEVLGPYRDPQWTFHSTTERPGWSGHRADRLALALAGGPGSLAVTEGVFDFSGGSLRAHARFDDMARPFPKTLGADDVTAWLSGAGRWDGEATAADLPVDDLGRINEVASGWSGRLGGHMTLGGSPQHPTFELRLDGRPLAWRGLSVESIEAQARYAGERLDVSDLRVTREGRASSVRGYLPIRLALGRKAELLDQAMQWHLDVPYGDLGWIAAMVPQVGTATGSFGLTADIGGTPREPDLGGTMRLQNGVLRLAGREEVFTGVRAALRLSRDRVTLDSLTAYQGQSGLVRANGEIAFKGLEPEHYRFGVTMRNCTALETGVYAVNFDGDFTVTDGPRVDQLWLPRVEGDLRAREAVILLDFANQSENEQLAATAAPLFWTYRVQVRATHRLYWRPPDGDVEFSANLNVEQTPTELIIYGDMHALRGTYYFLSNRYTVEQGDLTFDHVEGLNPQMLAQAVTTVVPLAAASTGLEVSTGDSESEASHRVTVRIEGRIKEPQISFASDPNDWDEARILRELTLGRFAGGNAAVGLGDPVDHYLTRAINRTLSSELERAFRGYINEWAIDRERGGLFGGEGELILGVGSQVTSNLQLRYRQRVPGLSRSQHETATTALERDLEAEYRLSRFFYVSSELVQRRQLLGSASSSRPEFNVNLKARWEY